MSAYCVPCTPKYIPFTIAMSPHSNPEESIIIPILQMIKLRFELHIPVQVPTVREPKAILTPKLIHFATALVVSVRSLRSLKIPLGCGILRHLVARSDSIGL